MELNELEIVILNSIVDYQIKINGINIKKQHEIIKVKNRNYTGFGIFVYFDLENQHNLTDKIKNGKSFLSSPAQVYLDSLEYQISFELNINRKGQFELLEIVPNGADS